MKYLKKGEKGNDTKAAQKLLNKNGAKLKEDGIFGPVTDAATRKFQKKVKLKPDGIIGPLTMGALKYGKPLPEMQTEDYVKFLAKLKQGRKDNADILFLKSVAQSTLRYEADKVMEAVSEAYEKYNASDKLWKDVFESGNAVIVKQKQFEKLRTSDPAAAEKLAKECAALDSKIQALGKNEIAANRKKAGDALDRANKAMDKAVKAVENCKKAVKAEKASWEMRRHLVFYPQASLHQNAPDPNTNLRAALRQWSPNMPVRTP